MNYLMKCEICDREETLPFRCNYCNKLFCDLHRIPMNHSCISLKDYVDKKNMMQKNTNDSNLKIAMLKIKFSKIEILHLLVATILVTAVGLYRRSAGANARAG